jgi:hypothetical protein
MTVLTGPGLREQVSAALSEGWRAASLYAGPAASLSACC